MLIKSITNKPDFFLIRWKDGRAFLQHHVPVGEARQLTTQEKVIIDLCETLCDLQADLQKAALAVPFVPRVVR